MLDFKKARNLDIKIIAEDLGITFDKYNKCTCIIHKEKTPSMSIYNNRLKCHVGGCNASIGVIDLYAFKKGLTEIQAVKELLEKYTIDYLEKRKKASSIASNGTNKNKDNKTLDIQYLLKKSTKIDNINSNKFIKNFLTGRCIPKSIDLLKNNNVDVYYNTYGNLESILYYFKKHKFIIQKAINKETGEKIKINRGTPFPSFFKVNNSKEVYICEGIEDSLSFMHFNRNSITLNSTSNTHKLFELLNNWKEAKEYKYIIATDNDEAGEKCKKELEEYFIKNNFCYDIYIKHITKEVKDINELWILKSKGVRNFDKKIL